MYVTDYVIFLLLTKIELLYQLIRNVQIWLCEKQNYLHDNLHENKAFLSLT